MNFRIEKIDRDLASSFSEFILPAVLKDEDFDLFTFYGAISGNTLCGILVSDIREFDPEILSFGVSPEYENNGIAKGLLSHALYDLFSYFDRDAVEGIPNQVSARVVEKAGKLGKMDHILSGFGFEPVDKGEFCEISIKDIKTNEYVQHPKILKKLNKPGRKTRYLSLKDMPHAPIHAFSNKLIEQNLFPGIAIEDLDEDLTIFGMRDNEISLCILFLKENQGVVQNNFLYQMKMDGMGAIELLYLMSMSATCAINKFPEDTRLSFWLNTDITRKIMEYMFPEAVCAEEAISYELPFTTLQKRRESKFTDDLAFNLLTSENSICAKCKHCMADKVMECEKYYQKPDSVFEGSECELYEEQ